MTRLLDWVLTMTTKSSQITVDGTAVLIAPAAPQYQEISLHASQPVFVGDSAVTSSTGYKLDKDLNFSYTLAPNTDAYAIGNGVTATLYVLATVL